MRKPFLEHSCSTSSCGGVYALFDHPTKASGIFLDPTRRELNPCLRRSIAARPSYDGLESDPRFSRRILPAAPSLLDKFSVVLRRPREDSRLRRRDSRFARGILAPLDESLPAAPSRSARVDSRLSLVAHQLTYSPESQSSIEPPPRPPPTSSHSSSPPLPPRWYPHPTRSQTGSIGRRIRQLL